MWRAIGVSGLMLGLLLVSPSRASARPERRAARPAAASLAGGSSIVEAEPNTGPEVMRDPEILNKTEMLSLARKYATDIATALLDGERQREEAVRLRDSIKLSCIQDRLSSMKLTKKLSDDRLAASERPEIRADDLNLRHEFRGVELAHERVTELHKELLECVGESLQVTVGPGGAPEAPNSTSSAPDPASAAVEIPTVDRPPPASMYK